MVNYIGSNEVDDTYQQQDDSLRRRRLQDQSLARDQGVDAAIRRGLRRVVPNGGGAAPGMAAPDFSMPSGSFGTGGGQMLADSTAITPTPVITPTPTPNIGGGSGMDTIGGSQGLMTDTLPPAADPDLTGGAGADQLGGGAGVDLLRPVESGNRQADANGNLLRSSAGAVGSMQIMPTTGPEAAAAAGVPWDEALFYDPGPAGKAYNEQLGDAHFNKLMQHYNGDAHLAAAAYNAGQGRVDQYVNQGRPLPPETVDYVNKVFGTNQMPQPGNAAPGRSGLRQVVADQPTGFDQYGPILNELADAPGGGEAALRLLGGAYQQDNRIANDRLSLERSFQNDNDQEERLALTALAHGDMPTFNYWSQKSGVSIPPQVLADAQLSSTYAKGMLLGEQFYKNDPDQAAKFVQAYVQGGPAAAFQAAGAPRSNPKVTLRDVMVGDQRQIARFDQQGNMLGTVTGADGQPVVSATGSSLQNGNANQSVRLRDYQALIAKGITPAMAQVLAFGTNGQTPGDRYLKSWVENAPKTGAPMDEKAITEAKRVADSLNAQLGYGQASLEGGAGGSVAAPDGVTVTGSRSWADGPDGSIYTDDGGQTWLNEDGTPYEPQADQNDVQPPPVY